MEPAPFAPDETGRLIALKDLSILDTPPERRFDRVVQLAARLTKSPIGILSFVDETRIFFKSVSGAEAAGVKLGTPFREYWFCSHVVGLGGPLVVTNAAADPRFDRLPIVIPGDGTNPVRSYAGIPVRAPGGEYVGALGVLSVENRGYSDAEIRVLLELGRLVEAELSSLPHSTIDALTGAVNARTFTRFGNRLLELAASRGEHCVVLRIDLKGTSEINTSLGFHEGDRALGETAQLLGSTVRGSDLVGRVGPDEFAVLLIGTDAAGAGVVLKRLREAVAGHNTAAGRPYQLSFQTGLVEQPLDAPPDLASLLTSAALVAELGL